MVDLILRWLHIFSAILLVGGIFFQRIALMPSLGSLADDQREAVSQSIRRFWSKCVKASAVFLLVSGLINAVSSIKAYEFAGPYHILVAVKLLLALAIFAIAELLAGKTSAAQKIRQKEAFWLNLSVLLTVIIVCVGGYMRSIERTPKTDETPPAAMVPDRALM